MGTLFNLKAEPVMSFGSAHRNTISWSPHGRFVVLAGFGNLSGGMDFWGSARSPLRLLPASGSVTAGKKMASIAPKE